MRTIEAVRHGATKLTDQERFVERVCKAGRFSDRRDGKAFPADRNGGDGGRSGPNDVHCDNRIAFAIAVEPLGEAVNGNCWSHLRAPDAPEVPPERGIGGAEGAGWKKHPNGALDDRSPHEVAPPAEHC